ncbi:NAD-dependent epimerase/dehydratase family protein [Herbiconiux sp. P18]|uniref:NAD-dependent epimerase/dehydratase family protein n=1 Tax=Herbiconiux liangxiaofengii TaxID=3342795 RepID=UPI0035B826AF
MVRIFLAGASGVIGQRLIPLLADLGHTVGGMTRSIERAPLLRGLGAEPVVCDVYDAEALGAAVTAFRPDLVLHQLTDLPDDSRNLKTHAVFNARMRREGTRNLLLASRQAGDVRVIAQSVAWTMPPGPGAEAVEFLEEAVLAAQGTVLRYGQFYGHGTYYEQDQPAEPRVHIEVAAQRTIDALAAPSGVLTIVD